MQCRSIPTEIIREMMKHSVMATINQQIDYDTAAIVAIGLGYEVSEAKPDIEEDLVKCWSPEQDAAEFGRLCRALPWLRSWAT